MMFAEVAFFPREASTVASQVDLLLLFLVTVCGSVTLLVGALLVYFSVRYRRRPGEVGNPPEMHAVARLGNLLEPGAFGLFRHHVFLGRRAVFFGLSCARGRRQRSTSSASNGCGSSSIPKGNARSTSFTFPLDGPCGCC